MKKCCLKQRQDFAKEILDMLDQVAYISPAILPVREAIRELRDKPTIQKENKND